MNFPEKSTDTVVAILTFNLSIAGLHALIAKILPTLEAIGVICQAIIGIYSVYHLFLKKNHKPKKDHSNDSQ